MSERTIVLKETADGRKNVKVKVTFPFYDYYEEEHAFVFNKFEENRIIELREGSIGDAFGTGWSLTNDSLKTEMMDKFMMYAELIKKGEYKIDPESIEKLNKEVQNFMDAKRRVSSFPATNIPDSSTSNPSK